MKISKKIVAVVMVLGIIISGMMPFHGRVSRAAGYTSAIALPMNGVWSSDYYLTETNDEHWYKIIVPSDGKVQIRLMHFVYNIYTDLYNSDFSNNIVRHYYYKGSESTPETDIIDFELSAGTYYLKITGDNGRYRMNTKFNSYQATDYNALSFIHPQIFNVGETMIGALTYTDNEDWYKITISKDFCYTIKLTHYMYNIRYELYNSDLSKKVSEHNYIIGDENTPEVDVSELVLSTGTYYLKITGDRGKYILYLDKLTQNNCSHEYESKIHYATYFKRGFTSYRCEKCGHSYRGDYTPVRKLGQGYVSSYSYTGKGKMILSWSTIADASGYQIRYSRNRKMKGATIKTVRGRTKNKKTIKRLSRRKRYFVQVRAYKKSSGKTVYGKWSSKRSWKTR